MLLTILYTAQIFALDAVPPDKPIFELELIANDAPENGFVNVVEQDPTINSDLIEKTLTAKTLSINQHSGSGFQVADFSVDKIAVIQNQNFDRMQLDS